jgi:hypothetical protein
MAGKNRPSTSYLKYKENQRKAKARKRMDNPSRIDMATPSEVYGTPLLNWIIQDPKTGEEHVLELRVSGKRKNSLAVMADGKPWKDQISMSRLTEAVRKRYAPRLLTY